MLACAKKPSDNDPSHSRPVVSQTRTSAFDGITQSLVEMLLSAEPISDSTYFRQWHTGEELKDSLLANATPSEIFFHLEFGLIDLDDAELRNKNRDGLSCTDRLFNLILELEPDKQKILVEKYDSLANAALRSRSDENQCQDTSHVGKYAQTILTYQLARYYVARGDFDKAQAYIDVAQGLAPPNAKNSSIQWTHQQLQGGILENSGQDEAALKVYLGLLDSFEDHPRLAQKALELALQKSAITGDEQLTLDLLERMPISDLNKKAQCILYHDLGHNFKALNQLDLALEYFEKGYEIARDLQEHLVMASIKSGIASTHSKLGEYHITSIDLLACLDHLKPEVSIKSMADVDSSQFGGLIFTDIWARYGENFTELYRKSQDFTHLENAIVAFDMIEKAIEYNSRHRRSSQASRMKYYNAYLSMGIDALLEECGESPSWDQIAKIYRYMETAKGNQLISLKQTKRCQEITGEVKLCQEQQRLRQKLDYLESQPIPTNDNLKEIEELNQKISSVADEIQKVNPDYYKKTYSHSSLSLEELQSLAELTSSSIIQYHWRKDIFSGNTVFVVVCASADTLIMRELDAEGLKDDISLLDSLISSSDPGTPELCRSLYERLIQPVAHVFDSDMLIIIPNDRLFGLSYDVLRDSNDQMLIENYAISYSYSAKSLQDQYIEQYEDAISYLGVTYDDEIEDALPMASKEVQSTMTKLRGHPRKVLSGSQANKSNFLKQLQRHNWIHLAAHSSVERKDAQLWLSSDSSDILTTKEIGGLDLEGKRFVLSSCQSAQGLTASSVGIYSLANTFRARGARSTVANFWDQPDISGAKIIPSYFAYLSQGEGSARALQKAKLDHLQQEKDPLLLQPKYWAGFQCISAD